jgi:DNA helicase-2/ATP-dependent DNA helicase PcrA
MGYTVPIEVLLDNRGKGTEYCRANLLRAMGEDFPLDEIYKQRKILNEQVFMATENVVKEGVETLLSWMKEHQILAAVASAKPCNMTSEHLEHAKLLEQFEVIIGGDMVENNKPEPDSFLKAAEMIGVSSKNCLVIGDTLSDMMAAKAAGMKAAFVPDLVEADKAIRELADVVLDRIDKIIDIIETKK